MIVHNSNTHYFYAKCTFFLGIDCKVLKRSDSLVFKPLQAQRNEAYGNKKSLDYCRKPRLEFIRMIETYFTTVKGVMYDTLPEIKRAK